MIDIVSTLDYKATGNQERRKTYGKYNRGSTKSLCSWLKIGQVETLAGRNLDGVTSDGTLFALTDCPCPGWSKEDLLSTIA